MFRTPKGSNVRYSTMIAIIIIIAHDKNGLSCTLLVVINVVTNSVVSQVTHCGFEY